MNRGVRNNNPGNIRIGKAPWLGKKPKHLNTDGSFEQFETLPHGYLAIIKLMETYRIKGFKTLRQIFNRYAPPKENNTNLYLANVVKWTGIGPDVVFPWTANNVKKLVAAIARQESGLILEDTIFEQAWSLASGKKKIRWGSTLDINFSRVLPTWLKPYFKKQ